MDSDTNLATKTGLKQLLLSNEFGPVDASKPFQPFGLSPKKDAAFIVGCEELFKKPGASFELKLKWLDLPKASEVDYDTGAEGDKTPNASIQNLTNGAWITLASNKDLWVENTLTSSGSKKIKKTYQDTIKQESLFPDTFISPAAAAFMDYDATYGPYTVKSRNGFIRIVLEAGFGYDDYQKAMTDYLIQSAFGGSATNPGVPPYVPKLESISLHYKVSVTENITNASAEAFAQKKISFYHLAPFGEAQQHAFLNDGASLSLLPQFAGDEYNRDSGELYIGITGLKGLQSVNLLFGVMEGTADPLTVKPEKHVSWSFLSNNHWKTFDTQAVGDGTAQLIQTGIVSFAIPEDATTDNTLLPAGYLWIRASVDAATLAVCKLLSIDAQAAVATFVDNDNDPGFLNLPLPTGTISKLKTAVPAIKKVSQPYASFGGRPAEARRNYYQRVSERLRHKDRAVTIWDYEHLILQTFPELNRVKCLSHTSYEQLADGTMRYNEVAPGHITIITIPTLVNITSVNPLRPYTSESTLAKIDAFVRARISCHIQPHVVHPIFEEVALDFQFRLMPGYDDYTFYKKTLKDEITAFLTPWAFGQSQDVPFGGKVSKSVLINFIEERPFVDYITNVKMYHRTEASPNSITDTDEIIASGGMSILVSVPAAKHIVEKIPDAVAGGNAVSCGDPYAKGKM